MPPVAPHTSTLSPCFMRAPLSATSIRYDVELHSALTAASSQVRWAGFGISWLALTTERSASPPKLVSNPQIRWLAASIESLCAEGSWSSTWLQCTVTLSPGFQLRTADPIRSTTPDASEPTTWYGSAWRAGQRDSRPRRSRNAKRRERLEDRRPDGVEVDARRHHREVHLVGRQLGRRDVVDVEALGRLLVGRRHTFEHADVVAQHERRPVRLGDRQVRRNSCRGPGMASSTCCMAAAY